MGGRKVLIFISIEVEVERMGNQDLVLAVKQA